MSLTNEWRKSPASAAGACLEAKFQSSPRCETNTCLEANFDGGIISVRDSKNKNGPVLEFTVGEWSAFLSGVRETDTFDLPAGVA